MMSITFKSIYRHDCFGLVDRVMSNRSPPTASNYNCYARLLKVADFKAHLKSAWEKKAPKRVTLFT